MAVIRSIRGGSAGLNEEDRLTLAGVLVKAGYRVQIGYRVVPGNAKGKKEYTVEYSKAINDDLNYLSMKCGFGTDRYQFGTSGVKTATEIISENSDMYRMIKKHEIILEDVLKQLIRIIIRLGIVTGNSLNLDTEIVINFDDSIIEDKDTERKRDLQDLSVGIMSHAEYRAKWYGETIEEAEKKLPVQSQVME